MLPCQSSAASCSALKHDCARTCPIPVIDAMHGAVQEWSAYAQTKTARHKLTKFLKDHGHLLEPDSAQSDSSSASEAASLNGASSATFNDTQVSCPRLFQEDTSILYLYHSAVNAMSSWATFVMFRPSSASDKGMT